MGFIEKAGIGLCCLCLWTAGTAGCAPGEPEGGAESVAEKEPPVSAGKEQLVVTYQTLPTSVLEDLDGVTDAVNAIVGEEIGAEITFRLSEQSEASTQYPLWISKGERIDLMLLSGQDISAYVSRGMLEPLDGLLESHGRDILGLVEEGIPVTEGAVVGDRTYGVAPVPELPVSGYGLWAPLSLVQEAGLCHEESHVYTLEELTSFFAQCKELYPQSYPLGQITSGRKGTTFFWYGGAEQYGGASDVGVLFWGDGAVNLYETAEYGEFLEYMRKWYQAGYIYPDAAFTDAYPEELAAEKLVLTYPGSSAPVYGMDELFGEEAVCLRTTPVTMLSGNGGTGFWTVPVTSGNPEAAMEFLNLLYRDARIPNLIQYGIASTHYVVLDMESGRISYPYGVSRKSTGYYNPLGLYGDRRQMYTFDTKELLARKQAYLREAENGLAGAQNQGEAPGVFETDRVNPELAALRKVVQKYVPVLESGSVGLEYYEEFLAQMRMAGLEKVMEEAGRQREVGRE